MTTADESAADESTPVVPTDVLPEYETDLTAVGVERQAEPPDGEDQHWTVVHPNGSREVLFAEEARDAVPTDESA